MGVFFVAAMINEVEKYNDKANMVLDLQNKCAHIMDHGTLPKD